MPSNNLFPHNDGYPVRWTEGTFSAIRAGAGNYVYENQNLGDYHLVASATTDQFTRLYRDIYTFDTSEIGTATLLDAILYLKYYYKTTGLGSNYGYGFTGCSPGDKTDLAASDFETFLNTRLTADIPCSTFDAYTFYGFALNAAGLAYINKTGYTSLMGRLSWDIDSIFGGSWASGASSGIRFYQNGASESNKPYLYIEYETPTGIIRRGVFFSSGNMMLI